MPILNNIESTYKCATLEERKAGLNWYKSAREFCRNLAEKYCLSLETVAGIVAALSPLNEWDKNKRDAEELIKTGRTSVINHKMVLKARKILNGAEPLDELTAPKTRRFYINIVDLESEVVTVDRHAIGCAYHNRNVKVPTAKEYLEVEKAYQTVAKREGLKPSELQAVCWVVWRRRDVDQLQLFN